MISPYTKSTQLSLTVHRFIPHQVSIVTGHQKITKAKTSPIRFDHEVRNFKTRLTEQSLHVLACHAKSTFKSRKENILDKFHRRRCGLIWQLSTALNNANSRPFSYHYVYIVINLLLDIVVHFKYRMPKVSKDVFKFSFFPRSITEWNLLPADLVNCKSLSNFKLNLGKLVNK